MKVVLVLIRAALVVAVFWAVLLWVKIIIELMMGGPSRVNGWVAHVALTGRPFMEASQPQIQQWIYQSYMALILQAIIIPVGLFAAQRRVAARIRRALSN